MKKIKGLLLSVLALGCVAMASCAPKGEDKYTVTLIYNGEVLSTMEKDKATHLDVPPAPTKDGYTFKGWYVDEALTIPYTPDLLSANLTLYAKFEANTLYITFNLNGGTMQENKVAVKTGEAYTLPTPTKEGYTFAGWTLDGEDFAANGTYQKTNSVKVSATWTINKYTVTFTDGTATLATVENVEHGKTVKAWNSPAAGYEVVGIYTDAAKTTVYDFDTPVTGALTLYVKVQPKTFNIIVNQDGDTQLDTTAVYLGAYTLPATPTREGYVFQGYTYQDEAFAVTGTYTWTEDIIVFAMWEKDPTFNKSTVAFYDGETEISNLAKVVENGTALSGLVDAPVKAGYTFNGWYTDKNCTTAFANGTVVNDDISLYAKYTPNTYKLIVNLDGGKINDKTEYSVDVIYGTNYAIPTPERNGYKFVGFKYGNTTFAATGEFKYAENVTVTAVWERLDEDPDELGNDKFLKKGDYFKEREDEGEFTYVFVTGKEYTFNGTTSVTALNADDAVTQNSKTVFTANKAKDSFTLEVTKVVEGTSITYYRNAKIVDQVAVFNGGVDYVSSWGTGVANRSVNFLQTKESATMAVGANNFKPDLAVATLNSQALTFAKAYVEVTAKVGGQATTAFEYVNGVINFDASLIGQTVELTFAPKYSLSGEKHTVTLMVNNGVNVYTNDDLRLAYGDHSTNTINVLRNIKAVVGSGALNPDGTPINAYQYGVYVRNVANPNDQVVINGNFFGIDGSQLPILKGPYQNSDPTVALTDVQTGIFLYKNGNGTSIANGYHSGQVTFNDLFVTGNYTMPSNTYEPMSGYDTGFLVAGGTYLGLVVEGGTMNVNNTTVTNSNIAVLMRGGVSAADATQQAAQLNLNYAKFEKSFNNSIYAWNTSKVDIKNSVLSNSGGALIHFDDLARPEDVVSSLSMDTASKFTNWITGMEAYWTCRTGMSTLAVGMKTTIEGIISEASKLPVPSEHPLYGKPLLTTLDSTAQKFNLVMLVQSAGGNADEWLYTDPQKMPMVNIQANTMTPTTPATSVPALLMNGQTFLQFDTAGLGQVNDQYRMGLLEVCPTIPLDTLLQYLG